MNFTLRRGDHIKAGTAENTRQKREWGKRIKKCWEYESNGMKREGRTMGWTRWKDEGKMERVRDILERARTGNIRRMKNVENSGKKKCCQLSVEHRRREREVGVGGGRAGPHSHPHPHPRLSLTDTAAAVSIKFTTSAPLHSFTHWVFGFFESELGSKYFWEESKVNEKTKWSKVDSVDSLNSCVNDFFNIISKVWFLLWQTLMVHR